MARETRRETRNHGERQIAARLQPSYQIAGDALRRQSDPGDNPGRWSPSLLPAERRHFNNAHPACQTLRERPQSVGELDPVMTNRPFLARCSSIATLSAGKISGNSCTSSRASCCGWSRKNRSGSRAIGFVVARRSSQSVSSRREASARGGFPALAHADEGDAGNISRYALSRARTLGSYRAL